MLNEKEALEFVKKIIKESNTAEEAVKQIGTLKDLLTTTKMANQKVLKTIDEMIKGLPDGYKLYKMLEEVKTEKKSKEKTYEDRHYNNYHTTSSSSCVSASCGGGSSSYSSSCGGGSSYSYTSRC